MPTLANGRAHPVQLVQQRQRAVEAAGRRVGVARGHEHVVHPRGGQPRDDVGQVRPVPDQPGRQVRHGPVAVPGQPLGQGQRRLQAPGRRGRDRDGQLARHPLQHRLLGAGRGQHLIPRRPQQRRARPTRLPRLTGPLRPPRPAALKLALQAARAGVDDGERQAEPPGDVRRGPVQLGVPGLGQPDQPPVVAEVVRPQLRVAVQAQPGQHRPVEAADQEVGQQVGAGLGGQQRGDPVRRRRARRSSAARPAGPGPARRTARRARRSVPQSA